MRSTSRRCAGCPGDFIGDLPVNAFIHPAGRPIDTSTPKVLRRPVELTVVPATVIDLASRRVVGWATADNLRTDLVAKALTNAVATRRPTVPVIFHSDCGCQYLSARYARLADQFGVRLSVGRKGQCWDNAVAESFFATIKAELFDKRARPTRAAAEQAIFEWIEGWYNTRRRHSTLDYLSPVAYETTAYLNTPTLKVA